MYAKGVCAFSSPLDIASHRPLDNCRVHIS
nr:MAG TPA: hypothetical protein [Caudoviricetes sp.]